MVQAGITKCYYFPAQFSELTSESTDKNDRINYSSLSELPNPSSNMHSSVYVTYKYNKQERDQISSKRHVSNNSIGLSLYIPKWNYIDEDSFELSEEGKKNDGEEIFTSRNNLLNSHEYTRKDRFQSFWTLDETLGSSPEMQSRWINISKKFERLTLALMYLQRRYNIYILDILIHLHFFLS